MLPESHSSQAIPFTLETYSFYAALMQDARQDGGESNLGGQLFWGGELDGLGRALAVAGSVCGAATLVATSDPVQQKQAVRDGVVNFLVTSLDEALRILKNEIRKHEPVAVCVGMGVEEVESEMVERGVRPDLIREGVVATAQRMGQGRGAKGDPERDPMAMEALVMWRVESAPAIWLAKLDAIALECLDPDDPIARRWIRRAGRVMGRLGHDGHGLLITREFGARLIERVREQSELGQIKVRGGIEVSFAGCLDQVRFGL